MKNYLFLFLFSNIIALFAQLQPAFNNSIGRIDSLTKQYMSELPPKICNHLCIDGFSPSNKSFFEEQMNSLGSEITFGYNEAVYGQLRYFSYNEASFLCRAMVNKNKYFPIFEETFDKYNLPTELKYISIIESALNPNAKSRAGAMGLWQFMPGTGKYLDLTITNKIDDRRSIKASTEKAAEYFKYLHNMFGDWLLAIAAYNAGPGNVRKAISNAGGVYDFWVVSKYLPRETQNYVPRFIAATYLMNFSTHIQSFHGVNYPVYCPIEISDTLEFEQLCRFTGIGMEECKALNSQFRFTNLKGDAKNNFEMLLPYDEAMSFLEKKDSIYYYSKNLILVAEVLNDSLKAKDSLTSTLVQKIAADKIAADKNLVLKEEKPQKPAEKVPPVTKSSVFHQVKRGETLYAVSKKYNVSLEELRAWNKLANNNIKVGDRLLIKK